MNNEKIELKVPSVGESVTEVEIAEWKKQEGDPVAKDETVAVLETDKATVEISSPIAGRLAQILKTKGTPVKVGEALGYVESSTTAKTDDAPQPEPAPTPPPSAPAPPRPSPQQPRPPESPRPPSLRPRPSSTAVSKEPRVMPSAARLMAEKGLAPQQVQPSGPGGRILKEDVQRATVPAPKPDQAAVAEPSTPAPSAPQPVAADEEVVPMSLMRRKIAERLVQAQHTAALLTTFNEIDMSTVMALRKQYQEPFQERYLIKLGFMSFFVKAVIEALKTTPQLNAEIRGNNIVYRNYYDIAIAIGSGRGLVVPVLRRTERLSFAEIEQAIADFAQRARDNKIKPEDLQGGTFTITNGGVYGSLLSTPIINPPQSGVLGMHTIQDRPIALAGQVVIRPMMYVALTYDHRIVDGREAVTFLRRVKDLIENPVRMLVEV